MARTSPVSLSIATSAALGSVGLPRYWPIACSAARCRSRSSVVCTVSPPSRARRAPNRSTSCWRPGREVGGRGLDARRLDLVGRRQRHEPVVEEVQARQPALLVHALEDEVAARAG